CWIKDLSLMSSLKADLSGGLFIMKSNSYEAIAAYLNAEPLFRAGVQTYCLTELMPHYLMPNSKEWIED
ncbi:MAG: hypothetical protein ACLVLR_14275, partial [Turicibacter sanguinis]